MSAQPPTLAQLQALHGQRLGHSAWHVLAQSRIDAFADVTEDWQFIHVDPRRAQTETAFGSTIAHGFLTLSLLPVMAGEAAPWLDDMPMVINYGFDKMRFLSPVPCGARVRGHFTLLDTTAKADNRVLLRQAVQVEIEGQEKPALAAEWLALLVLES